ncbi:MAG: DNRLRE domain-containing protein [Phycisphaerae bacterium]|nr:DNRLRE domain-containing protein [Phycisphaerae bacterium]
MNRVLVLCGSLFLASAGAGGAVVQIPSWMDNTLYQDPAGSVSNGAGAGMFAGRNALAQNSIRRGLIRFDVGSMVPAGAVITGATLTLFQASANVDDQVVSLHRVLESWGEGTSNATGGGGGGSGAAATPGDATWIHRSFNTTPWSTAGGVFDPAASASASVGGNGFYSWSSAALAADVQAFLDDGATNFGWLVRGNESMSSSAKRFATREEPSESLRPVLTLEYVVPGSGGVALLGVLGVSTGRRRRGAW